MLKIGALVPARIGSKRLPKKNIKILGNKPLICWTIDVLLEADIFYDITVSTESDEIADVVRQYYSEKEVKILKRPQELAQDDSPLRDVIYHYLEHSSDLEWYGIFMPTFPFRRVEKLREVYEAILSRYVWRVRSYTSKQYCLLDFFYSVEEGVRHFFRMPPLYCRFFMPVYQLVRVKYIDELWDTYGLTRLERTYHVIIDLQETIDIDTEEDFRIAEKLVDDPENFLREINGIKLKEYHLSNKWLFIAPANIDVNIILEKYEDVATLNTNG